MSTLGELTGRVLADIDRQVDGFAESSFRALTDPMSDLMAMLLVLALMHMSLSVAMGWAAVTVSSFLRLILRYAIVWGVLTSWPAFDAWFYGILTGMPDDIVRLVVGASGIDENNFGITIIIECFIDAGISIGDMLIENISISTIALVLIGIIILFLMLIVAAGVILVIGMSKIGIGVTTAVAPVFLAMLLFNGSKGFFDGWLRLAVGFAVTYLMAMVMLGFLLFVTEQTIEEFSRVDEISRVAEITEYLLIIILTIFLLRQIPSFGASIAGSAAIGVDGISKVTQNAVGAWNRAHGLRGDGRTNFARHNRTQQRRRAAGWAQQTINTVIGINDTPARARRDAVDAVKRKSAVDAARPAARKALLQGAPSKTAWNEGETL